MNPRCPTERTPYGAIDPPVRNLVRVLNRFPGVQTYTSCGGHPIAEREPGNSCQMAEGTWYVDSHIDRTDEGYASLEFFAWVAHDLNSVDLLFLPLAKPPWLNFPGKMLFYRWTSIDPDEPRFAADAFAEQLTDLRHRGFYVTAHQAKNWPEDW